MSLIDKIFYLEFSFADAGGLIPMNFSAALRAIRKPDRGNTFAFAPAPFAIDFVKPR
jgi:hypothetical protein